MSGSGCILLNIKSVAQGLSTRAQQRWKLDFMRFTRNLNPPFSFSSNVRGITGSNVSAFRQVLKISILAIIHILAANVKRTAALDLSHDGGYEI
jgi:hypothetical protein